MNETPAHPRAIPRQRRFPASPGCMPRRWRTSSPRPCRTPAAPGATRVRVSLAGPEDRPIATVADDGAGIAEPAVLLSFGENGWDTELVRREDAAGMGMLSLARRGCAVSLAAPDRRRRARTRLARRAHACALPRRGRGGGIPGRRRALPARHGGRVRGDGGGERRGDPPGRRECGAALPAARPLFADAPNTSAGDEPIERRAFLDGALPRRALEGTGVRRVQGPPGRASRVNDPDLNFHGLTITVRLPSVDAVTGARWTVGADVADCPGLELVLPARKEAVETPFLAEMREAARLAVYRAISRRCRSAPGVRGLEAGARRRNRHRPASAELRPWRPGLADLDDWREPPKLAGVGPDALVMACDPEPPEAQAFARAAKRAGIHDRLFEPDRRLEGYGWYDALPRVVNVHTEVTAGGRSVALDDYPVPERTGAPRAPLPRRPDAIRMSLAVRPAQGEGRIVARSTPTSPSPARHGPGWGDALPLVTETSAIEPCELARTHARGRSSRRRTTPTRTPGSASATCSTRRRCTSRPRLLVSATTKRAARVHRRCGLAASSSGSSRTSAASTSRGARPQGHRHLRRARRGGNAVKKPWTVQCSYAGYWANTVTVEADHARRGAGEGHRGRQPGATPGARSITAATPSSMPRARAPTRTPGSRDASLPVPDRFTEHGEPPVVTMTDPARPDGGIEVTRGRGAAPVPERRRGTVTAEMRGPPHPPDSTPLVTVRRGSDGRPDVTVTEGRARIRVLDE